MRKNIKQHIHSVKVDDRRKINRHTSKVVWFTGLSGSGKSTLAGRVEFELYKKGWHTYLLDGDNIRLGLNSDLEFSINDRKENIRRIGEVSKLFVDAGIFVLAAFISPLQEDRDFVRSLFIEGDYIEIFIDCSLQECESRDVKGLYSKVRNGEIDNFTGIDSPFEQPINPHLIINSEKNDIETSVNIILEYLLNHK